MKDTLQLPCFFHRAPVHGGNPSAQLRPKTEAASWKKRDNKGWGRERHKNHKPTRHSVRDLQKCCIPYKADSVNFPVPGPYPVRKSSQEGKTKFRSTPGLIFPINPVQYIRLFPFLVARIFLLFYKF